MVDLETLGTDSNAIILTIGAIPFAPDGTHLVEPESYFYEKVNLNSYNEYKNNEFSIDWGTLIWWLKQDSEPLREAFLDTPRYPIWDVMQDFVNWINIICDMCGDHNVNIWSHGKDFDVVLLENAFKICNIDCPWDYVDTRDTRTLYALAGVDMNCVGIPGGYKAHNAIGDCLKQIEGIRLSYNVINQHIQQNNQTRCVENEVTKVVITEEIPEETIESPESNNEPKRRRSKRLVEKNK